MHNFRQPKRKYRHNPVDGILSPAMAAKGQGRIGEQFARSYQPSGNTGSIGNFNTSEGYQSNQSSFSADSVANTHPMNLDDAPVRSGRRYHKRGTKRSKRKILFRLFLVIIIIAAVIGAYIGIKTYIKSNNIFKGGGAAPALDANVTPAKLKGEGDGRVNVLLLGKGGVGHEGPDLTDTILLASIDPVQKEAALLSIPRDFWVKTDGGSSMKINAVYAIAKQNALAGTKQSSSDKENAEKAGIAAIEKTVTSVLGVPIHYYTMVDFEAFRKSIDTVGGITIDVKTALVDQTVAWELGGNPVIASVGVQNFNGNRALFYARSRHGSARGDFDRSERQRQVIVAKQLLPVLVIVRVAQYC